MKSGEAKCKIDGFVETLASMTDAEMQSEQFRKWLDTQSKFHRYSYYNTLLIHMYKPDATYVAGYKKWQELGRYVKPGEKGIPILAPMRYKVETDDEAEDHLYFRVVFVFDVSQTDGKPLDTINNKIDTDNHADVLSVVEGYVMSKWRLIESDSMVADGCTDCKTYIQVRPQLSGDDRLHVLLHELSHIYLSHNGRGDVKTKEIEAEGAAYVVSNMIGITPPKSEVYLSSYSATSKDILGAMKSITMVSNKLYADMFGKECNE